MEEEEGGGMGKREVEEGGVEVVVIVLVVGSLKRWYIGEYEETVHLSARTRRDYLAV